MYKNTEAIRLMRLRKLIVAAAEFITPTCTICCVTWNHQLDSARSVRTGSLTEYVLSLIAQ